MTPGHRELTPAEKALIETVRHHGERLERMLESFEAAGCDKRWLAIGRTDLQRGLMAITRAVAKPEFF